MAIPSFEFLRSRRKVAPQEQSEGGEQALSTGGDAENGSREKTAPATSTVGSDNITPQAGLKGHILALRLSVFFYLVSVIFLLLTEIGNTHNKPVLRSSYFLKINIADILVLSSDTPDDASLANSIARSLGLHDFYQIGLWNFCEGYNDVGITDCSKPKNLWWFNPVQIILNELLAGATVALPSEITTILTLIHVVSNVMFGFFLIGLLLNFFFIFLTPIVLLGVWYSYHFVTFAFISALLSFAGSTTATVMYTVFQRVITSQKELNISASLGAQMFAFMWIGTGFSIAGWIVHFHLAIVSRKEHHSTKAVRKAEKAEKKRERKAWRRKEFLKLWKEMCGLL